MIMKESDEIFKAKSADSEGFAKLFYSILLLMNIKCKIVKGICKNQHYLHQRY
jgi:hypothetical protein